MKACARKGRRTRRRKTSGESLGRRGGDSGCVMVTVILDDGNGVGASCDEQGVTIASSRGRKSGARERRLARMDRDACSWIYGVESGMN